MAYHNVHDSYHILEEFKTEKHLTTYMNKMYYEAHGELFWDDEDIRVFYDQSIHYPTESLMMPCKMTLEMGKKIYTLYESGSGEVLQIDPITYKDGSIVEKSNLDFELEYNEWKVNIIKEKEC